MSKMIDQLFLTLSKMNFKFNSSDPTAMSVGTPLFKTRSEILVTTFDEVMLILNMKPK